MSARISETSRISDNGGELSDSVSDHLEQDRRKMPVWVPKSESYGKLPKMLIVGFDAEWVKTEGSNHILSYQYHACNTETGSWNGIFLMREEKRLKLRTFILKVIREGMKKKLLLRWPKHLCIVSHFSLSDLAAFSDFKLLKMEFDSIRRTYLTLTKEYSVKVTDENRHQHEIQVTLRDSLLLAPTGKQSLADVGELVEVEKIELPDGAIERMDLLLAENYELFEEYALQDPKVSLAYVMKMLALNLQINGDPKIPSTLSSMGVSFLLKLWSEKNIDKFEVLGTCLKKRRGWNSGGGHYVTTSREEKLVERALHEELATQCYHGGRNEQYSFGAGAKGLWTDYDLCGAYPTAMSLIGMPQWKDIYHSRELEAFQPHFMGYARIRFSFPDGTRFPCLPVRTDYGLIFPLAGETFCCAPEIYLAQQLGAKIELLNGIILPAADDIRPFEAFVVECTARRNQHEKGTLENLFWKEMTNGTYGKTAQGVREKKCFNSRTGDSLQLPPSKITNPFIAAFVTSFVRATLGEVLARLPPHVAVSNATTDGFLSTVTEEEVRAAEGGRLCEIYRRARMRICGAPLILEPKHRIAQPLGWRTRGQATLERLGEGQIVLAKAGIKAPKKKDKLEQNEWIISEFLKRTGSSKYVIEPLRSQRDLWHNGGDLVSLKLERRLSMEYDWKRRPVNPTTRHVRGMEHLFFETAPWATTEDHKKCREAWETYNRDPYKVLKTAGDLAKFEEYQLSNLSGTGLKRSRSGGTVKTALRMFLRAYVRSKWGLDAKHPLAMSYRDLAEWLTGHGYSTKREDLENSNRSNCKLVGHRVPKTPEVETFLAVIQAQFPTFEASMLLKA